MFYHGTLLSFCSFHIPFNVDKLKLSCLRIHELCVKMCTWCHVHIGRPPDAMCPMFGHTRRLGGEQLVSHVWNVNWPPSPISPPLPRMSRRNAVCNSGGRVAAYYLYCCTLWLLHGSWYCRIYWMSFRWTVNRPQYWSRDEQRWCYVLWYKLRG